MKNVPLPAPATLSLLALDARSESSLQQQLLVQLRENILKHALRPGQRLPSTRVLSDELGVSRNTILAVFDQLQSEGYLSGNRGSGTYVSGVLPEVFLKPKLRDRPPAKAKAKPLVLSSSPISFTGRVPLPFRPCMPSVAEFPLQIWEKLRRRVLDKRGIRLLEYALPSGDAGLQEEIAGYVNDYRGVRCQAEQVLVTAGAQQAFDLIGRVMGGFGAGVWMEDPGYQDAAAAFVNAGMVLHPQPIDEQGLTLPKPRDLGPRLAYLTPSRQFPLGVTMTLQRRMQWLTFARNHRVWLVEDDYDSEFRYEGRPLPSLQGLIEDSRVLYVGTFSKSLYPSLRLGYVIVPLEHLTVFHDAKSVADSHCPIIEQAVLAEFMREGHFLRHLRKMRTIYGERAQVFQDTAREYWSGLITVTPSISGLNIAGYLPPGSDDRVYSSAAARAGFQIHPLSSFVRTAKQDPGLLFGFGPFSPTQIRRAIRDLTSVWEKIGR